MLQNIEGSRNLSIRKEKKFTTKKEDDLVKKRDLKKQLRNQNEHQKKKN